MNSIELKVRKVEGDPAGGSNAEKFAVYKQVEEEYEDRLRQVRDDAWAAFETRKGGVDEAYAALDREGGDEEYRELYGQLEAAARAEGYTASYTENGVWCIDTPRFRLCETPHAQWLDCDEHDGASIDIYHVVITAK